MFLGHASEQIRASDGAIHELKLQTVRKGHPAASHSFGSNIGRVTVVKLHSYAPYPNNAMELNYASDGRFEVKCL